MNHPLTTCISEIGFLQERIREKNARIEALEAALHRIDDTSIDHVAVGIARAALAEGQNK